MKRQFEVTGHQPVYSKEVNAFLAACDIGVTGVFQAGLLRVFCTVHEDCSEVQKAGLIPALEKAFESLGWEFVVVREVL